MNIRLHKSTAIIFFIFTLLGNLSGLLWSCLAVFIHEAAHLAVCCLVGETAEEIDFGIWGMNLKTKKQAEPAPMSRVKFDIHSIPRRKYSENFHTVKKQAEPAPMSRVKFDIHSVPRTKYSENFHKLKKTADTKKYLIIWASGPIFSFFVFAVFFLLEKYNFFMYANFCIGTINLIPALPLDGGMLIKIILSGRLGIIRAGKIMSKITTFFCVSGVFTLILCLMLGIFNVSFFIFIPMLIISRRSWKKQMLFDKQLVLSGGVSCTGVYKYIAVDSSSELLAVAELISPSYTLFTAVFEKGKFIGAMTQDEILSCILQRGALATAGECFCEKN